METGGLKGIAWNVAWTMLLGVALRIHHLLRMEESGWEGWGGRISTEKISTVKAQSAQHYEVTVRFISQSPVIRAMSLRHT